MSGDVKIFLTRLGQIIAKVVEETDTGYLLSQPAILTPTQTNVAMFPVLGLTKEKEVWLEKTNLELHAADGKQGLEPVVEIVNHYNSMFGSGIQIAQSI